MLAISVYRSTFCGSQMALLANLIGVVLLALCNCNYVNNNKLSYAEKLNELWENRSNSTFDFYDFMRTDVLSRNEELKMETQIEDNMFNQQHKGKKSVFPCKIFHNRSKPESVHRLKPSDVDLIAAIGDSITAAFGAKSRNLLEIFAEFRGVSWSAGGDGTLEDVTTLPNIIKKYNPDVEGFSVKVTPPKIRIPCRSRLNYAVSGAIAIDLPGQAAKLIKDLKSRADYADSWKVLTLWIGGNDLCGYCKNDKHTPDKYIGGIRDALDMFHKEVPKMFVNLVQILDVTRLNVMTSPYCKILHKILCYCGTSAGEEIKKNVSDAAVVYQKRVDDLIQSKRYDTRDDFTVVIQPFFEQTQIPLNPDKSVDMTFIAPDCFHFSEKGHRAAALALWNSMIEPVGQKRLMWFEGEKFECPREDFPYFYTNKNSNETVNMTTDLQSGGVVRSATNLNTDQTADKQTNGKKVSTTTTVVLIATGSITLIAVAVCLAITVRKRKYKEFRDQETSQKLFNSL